MALNLHNSFTIKNCQTQHPYFGYTPSQFCLQVYKTSYCYV